MDLTVEDKKNIRKILDKPPKRCTIYFGHGLKTESWSCADVKDRIIYAIEHPGPGGRLSIYGSKGVGLVTTASQNDMFPTSFRYISK